MVEASRLREYATQVLIAAGAEPAEAADVAEVLVWADLVGRPNQGIWRLPVICKRLEKHLYNSPCNIELEMKTPALGLADANAGLGPYVARRMMHMAISNARNSGICALWVRNSNHYGAAGYYVAMAAAAGMAGITLSNSLPKTRAYNGARAVLGTNPLAFACPALPDTPLVVDMATSASASSNTRLAHEKVTGGPVALNAGQPGEHFGGAKGYALGLVVEILSGVLSGSGYSHGVKSMFEDFSEPNNTGHCFMAVDIEQLMPLADFTRRMKQLIGWLRASGGNASVRYPGEIRWRQYHDRLAHGLVLDDYILGQLHSLGRHYDLDTTALANDRPGSEQIVEHPGAD